MFFKWFYVFLIHSQSNLHLLVLAPGHETQIHRDQFVVVFIIIEKELGQQVRLQFVTNDCVENASLQREITVKFPSNMARATSKTYKDDVIKQPGAMQWEGKEPE